VAVRLREAGGILLGKTTTSEFGARATVEDGLCPVAHNPWNREHTAGGSSGGAALAVAAGMGPIAEGSDGGGSIRIPSACCGVAGLKPSRGRITYAPSQGESWGGCGTRGPIARSVRDIALMLDAMAGPALGDPYGLPMPPRPISAAVAARPRNLRLAALGETVLAPIDSEVLAAFDSACAVFRAMGHRVEPIKLDLSRLLEPVQTIAIAGIGSIAAPDVELIEPVTRGIYKAGRQIAAADYIGALTRMHNIAREIIRELAPYDALLTPTLTRPAVKLGTLPSKTDPWVIDATGRRIADIYTWTSFMYTWTSFMFPFNATGQPAFSLPNGFTKAGLPIGLQIVGRPADEATIISIAAAFEDARPWRGQHPPVD